MDETLHQSNVTKKNVLWPASTKKEGIFMKMSERGSLDESFYFSVDEEHEIEEEEKPSSQVTNVPSPVLRREETFVDEGDFSVISEVESLSVTSYLKDSFSLSSSPKQDTSRSSSTTTLKNKISFHGDIFLRRRGSASSKGSTSSNCSQRGALLFSEEDQGTLKNKRLDPSSSTEGTKQYKDTISSNSRAPVGTENETPALLTKGSKESLKKFHRSSSFLENVESVFSKPN